MTTELVPAPVVNGRRLDWFPRFDPASRGFAAAPGVDRLPTRGRLWPHGKVLDQGNEGACCGFAAAAEAAAQPVPVPRVTNAYARGWYRNAQRRDEWPGEQYDGTSVLATMKEGKARGVYGRYGWFFTVEQLAHGIVRDEDEDGGPAVAGVQWRQGSYDTDELGVLRPSGPVVGGHALCFLGFMPDTDEDPELWAQLEQLDLADAVRSVIADEDGAFIVQNSWGATFGRGGLMVVPASVVRGWFDSRGEFAQPQQRRLPARKGTTVAAEAEHQDGTSTLHITMADVLERDRILDPPEELRQESATVLAEPQRLSGRRVRVRTSAGTFTISAATPVTVRRPQ